MTIHVDALYEDGVLKPTRPLALKEKAKVHVTIEAKAEETPAAEDDDPTGWKTARRFIGLWKGAPKGEPIAREQRQAPLPRTHPRDRAGQRKARGVE